MKQTKMWHHDERPIDKLLPNGENPRKISKRQAEELQNSISRFGLCQPIVINSDDTVIGGHQRLQVLHSLGYKRVDVWYPQSLLTPAEAQELSIRLNRNTGYWDYDILANSWDLERLCEWGFSPEDFQLESTPEQEKPRKFTLTIDLKSYEDLEEMEKEIEKKIDSLFGASYKVKIS